MDRLKDDHFEIGRGGVPRVKKIRCTMVQLLGSFSNVNLVSRNEPINEQTSKIFYTY